MEEIKALSNDEFVNELKANGLFSGPINSSTRKIFENRLLNYRSKLKGEIIVNSAEDSPGDSDLNESISSPLQNGVTVASLPSCFYGVFSVVDNGDDQTRKVFHSQKDALKAMKSMENPRFKQFLNLSDAERFAKFGFNTKLCLAESNTKKDDTPITEPISKYKSLKTQDYSALKENIEKGDIDAVKEKCQCNPLYLISRIDTPTVVQVPCRYNSMHVAVKANQLNMCQYIIETISKDIFWKDLYPEMVGEDNLIRERIDRAIDLYLNTPDKIMSCTPLHFACSLGHAAIVEYLISLPSIEKNRINKYGESASQMVCCNYKGCKSSLQECKEEILELLKGRSIVPVFQSNCASLAPEIGKPIAHSTEPTNEVVQGQKQTANGDIMRAYAGPMSPAKAKMFFHNWKLSPKKEQYKHVALSDYDKGFERIGRELAFNDRIPWKEFWPFLQCYADLSSNTGLKLLEQYFEDKLEECRLNSISSITIKPLSDSTEVKDGKDCKRNLISAFDMENTTDSINHKLNEDTSMSPSSSDTLVADLIDSLESMSLSSQDVTTSNTTYKDYFIVGDHPTKLDMDVYRAVSYAKFNAQEFPLIGKWMSAVESYTSEDRNRWSTPAVVKFKSRTQEIRSTSNS